MFEYVVEYCNDKEGHCWEKKHGFLTIFTDEDNISQVFHRFRIEKPFSNTDIYQVFKVTGASRLQECVYDYLNGSKIA